MENKIIKYNNADKIIKFFYKTALFFITTIFLIGSFIIVSLKKSYWDLFIIAFTCKSEISCDKEDFKKKANFFEYFHEQLLKEPIDLNLILFWNFWGIKISNSIGFRLTSGIFLFFNALILLLTYNISYEQYEKESCKYSYPKIFLFFFNWAFMAFFFGASSLLAQQKLIDYYSLLDYESNKHEMKEKYKILSQEKAEIKDNDNTSQKDEDIILIKYTEDDNNNDTDKNKQNIKKNIKKQNKEKIKRNFDSLPIFCLANAVGYMGKYGIGIGFTYYKQNNIEANNETNYNNTNNNISVIIKYFN